MTHNDRYQLERFANLIANGMGFTEKTFFAVTDRKRQDVDMQDLFAK